VPRHGTAGGLRCRRDTTPHRPPLRRGCGALGDRWAAGAWGDELRLGGVQRADLGRDIGEAIVNGRDELGDVCHPPRVRNPAAARFLDDQTAVLLPRRDAHRFLPRVAPTERPLVLLFADGGERATDRKTGAIPMDLQCAWLYSRGAATVGSGAVEEVGPRR
jgi:hypothetical protein